MKTEQEQIEEMATILSNYCDKHNYDLHEPEIEDLAIELYNAGYGDVSEYKAEIERLRTTLGQCNTELNNALETLRNQCREIGELKSEVKQSQIDVLNRLKRIMTAYSWQIGINDVQKEIDELIKEVEKQ